VITLQDWQTIRRRCLIDKESITKISRETGYSRTTLRKYVHQDAPPQRTGMPTRLPKLAPFGEEIDSLLKETPKITAIRIQHILKQRYPEIDIEERAVRKFVAQRREQCKPKEVFIRQLYQPGDQTQYDFKDVKAIIGGKEVALHLFSARLSYSTVWFAKCYHTEDQPAFFDGIYNAAEVFCGVTKDGVFDNASTAVKKIFPGRSRLINPTFSAFIGTYATTMQYAAPRKGNEKGGVEGVHGYIEDNFFRPMPIFATLGELNAALLDWSIADRSKIKNNGFDIGERFAEEQQVLRRLPLIAPRPCVIEHSAVNKFSEVRHQTNRYSVPSKFVGKMATLEIFCDTIRIVVHNELVAEHERLFVKHGAALHPLHYLDVLERKHRAVERAEVLTNERVPLPLRLLLKRLIEDNRDTAGKRFVRVLRLLETHSVDQVTRAVTAAEQYHVLDPDAIALLLEQQKISVPVPIALSILPLPAQIASPQVDLSRYKTSLLMEAER
jgi:transposase